MSTRGLGRTIGIVALAILVAVGGLPPGIITATAAGNGCTPISGQVTIDSAGCYYLTGDIEPSVSSNSHAIEIVADDVVFDGMGHWINGTNAGSWSDGIRVGPQLITYSNTNYTNVTVKNVNVHGWHEGGKVVNASVAFENVDFLDNTNGLVLEFTDDSVLEDTSFEGDKYALSLKRASNTTLENVDVRGSDARATVHTGIQIYASEHTTMRNSSVRDSDLLPFYVQGPTVDRSPSHFVHDIDTSNTVDGEPIHYYTDETDLTIDAPTGVGFLGVANSTNVTVRNYQLSGKGQGLLVANSDTVLVEDVTLTGNYYGFTLYGTTGATVRDSVIDDSGRFGIEATDVTGTIVDNVTVTDTDDPGNTDRAAIWVEGGLATTVTNSTIWNNENKGVVVYGNETTITANDVKGSPTSDGIFTAGFDSTVTHNVVDFYQTGIDANAVNESIAFNRITTTGTGIVSDGDNTTVHSNELSGAVQFGIDVGPYAVTVRNNSVTNSVWGVYVDNPDVDDAVHVFNNTLTDNDRGVVLDSAEGVRIEDNDVRRSAEWAFYSLDDSLRVEVTDLEVGYPLAFTGTDVALGPATTPPADPSGYHNVSRFLSVKGTDSWNAESWINATLPYDESDVTAAGVSESSLALWFHNDTSGSWEALPGSAVDTAANEVQANLTFLAEDDTGVLAILGDAATPSIDVSPATIDFGTVTNETTATAQVTVTNTGGASLTVSGVSVTGDNATEFDVPTTGFGVPASASETVTVTFAPASPGAKSATVEVDSDDPANPTISVTLTGTATIASSGSSGGTGNSGSNGGSSSSPRPPSQPPSPSVSVSSSGGVSEGTVRNAQAGVPVDIPLPYFPESEVAVTGLNVTTNTDLDYTINVSHSDAPPVDADFQIGDGQVALGYLSVGHSVPDAEIDAVQFTFRVEKSKLTEAGVDPADLTLHRNVGGSLTPLPTRQVDEDATHWVFEADSPGLSVFAITSTSVPSHPTSPTETSADTPDANPVSTTSSTPATDTDPSSAAGSGFGILVALVALLVVAVRTGRRRNQ